MAKKTEEKGNSAAPLDIAVLLRIWKRAKAGTEAARKILERKLS